MPTHCLLYQLFTHLQIRPSTVWYSNNELSVHIFVFHYVVLSFGHHFRSFDYFILFTIFMNCVALAVVTPYPNGDSNWLNGILVSYLNTDNNVPL